MNHSNGDLGRIRAVMTNWQGRPELMASLLKTSQAPRSNEETIARDEFIKAVNDAVTGQFEQASTGFAYLSKEFGLRFIQLWNRGEQIAFVIPGYPGTHVAYQKHLLDMKTQRMGLNADPESPVGSRRTDMVVFKEVFLKSRVEKRYEEAPRLLYVVKMIRGYLAAAEDSERFGVEVNTLLFLYVRAILDNGNILHELSDQYPELYKLWMNHWTGLSKSATTYLEKSDRQALLVNHVTMLTPLLDADLSVGGKVLADTLRATLLSLFQLFYSPPVKLSLEVDDNWLKDKLENIRERERLQGDYFHTWTGQAEPK